MGLQIEIKGMDKVANFLKEKSVDIINKAENAIKQSGFYIQGEVQASIAGQRAEHRSVDTGRFMGSVKTIFPQQLVAVVETNVEYAKHLEYGTSRMAPRSHFRNTVARNEHKVKEFIEKELK